MEVGRGGPLKGGAKGDWGASTRVPLWARVLNVESYFKFDRLVVVQFEVVPFQVRLGLLQA